MNFFLEQDRARSRTSWLLFLFGAAVVGTILGVHFAGAFVWGSVMERQSGQIALHWDLLPRTALCTLAVILIAVWMKKRSLSGGGVAVAEQLGGRRIAPNSGEPAERRLLNVVEEMSIASGVPVPAVFVLEEESAINAFAAGLDPAEAVVAVSRGCMRRLNREELQGVVAHEFSHILNGDMRMNFRMIGWIAGIVALTVVGRVLLEIGVRTVSRRTGGSSKKDGANALAFGFFASGLVLLVVGCVGAFFGRWIQSAISRQREFLADASAVQFTRFPSGIAGALKKIGGFADGSALRAPRSTEARHMMFGESAAGFFSRLFFATHPPLKARIRAIEPGWTGEFPDAPELSDAEFGAELQQVSPLNSGRLEGREVSDDLPPPLPVLGEMPGVLQTERARRLLAELPGGLREISRDPGKAAELLLMLVAATQEGAVDGAPGDHPLAGCSMEQRMVLLELVVPTLRIQGHESLKELLHRCEQQIRSDGQVNLAELAMLEAIRRHIGIASGLSKPPAVRHTAFKAVREEFRVILSALVLLGHESEEEREASFVSGWREFGQPAATRLRQGDFDLDAVHAAFRKCEEAVAGLRGKLLSACMKASLRDGRFLAEERFFVRAIADAIGTPLPPFPET
jgi:Zn-dependent protease with chaperone function